MMDMPSQSCVTLLVCAHLEPFLQSKQGVYILVDRLTDRPV